MSLTRGTPGDPDAVEATVCRAEPIHVGAGTGVDALVELHESGPGHADGAGNRWSV